MNEEFKLPGAPKFTKYLKKLLEGELLATRLNHDDNMTIYELKLDGKVIGSYTKLNNNNGFYFTGKLPRYTNKPELNDNIFSKQDNLEAKINYKVELIYSKINWEPGLNGLYNPKEEMVKRRDNCKKIPFP